MARPESRRSTHVQPEKPAAPVVAAPEGEGAGQVPVPPPPRMHWGWRLIVFLWGSSFFFLLLYELLAFLLRALSRLFS